MKTTVDSYQGMQSEDEHFLLLLFVLFLFHLLPLSHAGSSYVLKVEDRHLLKFEELRAEF